MKATDTWTAVDKAWIAGVLDGYGHVQGERLVVPARSVLKVLMLRLGRRGHTDELRVEKAVEAAMAAYRRSPIPGGPRASAAWLAAVLDTHGSISIDRRPKQVYVPIVQVACTREALVRRVQVEAGIGTVLRIAPNRWRWKVASRTAHAFLERVGPYVVEKKHQVAVVRRLLEARSLPREEQARARAACFETLRG